MAEEAIVPAPEQKPKEPPKFVPTIPIHIWSDQDKGPRVEVIFEFHVLSDTTNEKIDKLIGQIWPIMMKLDPPIIGWNRIITDKPELIKRVTKQIQQPVERAAIHLDFPRFMFKILNIRLKDDISVGYELFYNERLDKLHHLPWSARTKHVYIAGKSQYGKSTLLFNLAWKDMWFKDGVAVIDPHGDLVEKLLKHIPDEWVDRVIYLDAHNAVPIDFMSYADEREMESLVGDIIFLLQRFPGWGPRMDAILRNLLYTLLEARDVSFLDIYHFLVDKQRRDEILTRVKKKNLLRYWEEDFPKRDALEPILNRMTTFVLSPSLQTFLGGTKPKLKIYDIMEEQKFLLVNLAKSGRESGDLLGALIVSKIQQAAMRRGVYGIPPEKRKHFFLYTDEFQRFQTTAFDIILSEAGKFKLGLVMAHQYIDQLDGKILSSVLGNVSTMFLFNMDTRDARHFASSIPYRDFFGEETTMDPLVFTKLSVGNCLFKAKHIPDGHKFIDFDPIDVPECRNAEIIKKRTVEKYSCNTENKMLDSNHGASNSAATATEDDEIQPTGKPDIPPHEN